MSLAEHAELLEELAHQLRDGDLPPEQAAALVARAADAAARAAEELERRARDGAA